MAHFLSKTTPPKLRAKLLLNLPICYRTRFIWKSESFGWFKVLHIYENWQNYKMPFKQCRKHNKTTLHPEAQNYPATCHQHLGDFCNHSHIFSFALSLKQPLPMRSRSWGLGLFFTLLSYLCSPCCGCQFTSDCSEQLLTHAAGMPGGRSHWSDGEEPLASSFTPDFRRIPMPSHTAPFRYLEGADA